MDNQQQRPSGRSLRGFASMDKDKQRADLASKRGGRAAHGESGTAHEFNSHEASMWRRRRVMNGGRACMNLRPKRLGSPVGKAAQAVRDEPGEGDGDDHCRLERVRAAQPMESVVAGSMEEPTAGEMSGMSAGHSQSDHNPA